MIDLITQIYIHFLKNKSHLELWSIGFFSLHRFLKTRLFSEKLKNLSHGLNLNMVGSTFTRIPCSRFKATFTFWKILGGHNFFEKIRTFSAKKPFNPYI